MCRKFLALVALAVACLVAPAPARAQTYKMEKVDIKGDGGTDYVSVEPPPAACSCRARRM